MDKEIIVALIGFAGALVGAFALIVQPIIRNQNPSQSGGTTHNMNPGPVMSSKWTAIAASFLLIGLFIVAVGVGASLQKPAILDPASLTSTAIAPTSTASSTTASQVTSTQPPAPQPTDTQPPPTSAPQPTDTQPPKQAPPEQNNAGPFREHKKAAIGTGPLMQVTFSDGMADFTQEYLDTNHHQIQRIRLEDNPDGCGVSIYDANKIWFSSSIQTGITINDIQIAKLVVTTDKHGYIFEWPLKTGDKICVTKFQKSGFDFTFGPDLYYHYYSYCSRGNC